MYVTIKLASHHIAHLHAGLAQIPSALALLQVSNFSLNDRLADDANTELNNN